jgi:hypothetical protein
MHITLTDSTLFFEQIIYQYNIVTHKVNTILPNRNSSPTGRKRSREGTTPNLIYTCYDFQITWKKKNKLPSLHLSCTISAAHRAVLRPLMI